MLKIKSRNDNTTSLSVLWLEVHGEARQLYCTYVLCVWLCVLTHCAAFEAAFHTKQEERKSKQLLVFLLDQASGPQGAHRNKTLLSAASYTSTPAAHKSPL